MTSNAESWNEKIKEYLINLVNVEEIDKNNLCDFIDSIKEEDLSDAFSNILLEEYKKSKQYSSAMNEFSHSPMRNWRGHDIAEVKNSVIWKRTIEKSTYSDTFFLSIVVPMYNEEDVCVIFFDRIVPILKALTDNYEIICVNDCSDDQTLDLLGAAHLRNPRIKIINLARNFGKELALTAGIDYASGDAVIPIDADLQDPPELIPRLVEKWREGYDMVVAQRSDRRSDTLAKRISARLFYRLISRTSEVPIPADTGDFRLMDRRVVEALKMIRERTRFMKGLFAWLGFKQATISYVRPSRAAGGSKWKYWRLWNFALDGIFSFTTLPLRVWTYFGLIIAGFSLSYMLVIIFKTLMSGISVPGYASLIVVILFFSGLNMIGLGILGEYVGRLFIEAKKRPLYIVRDTSGFGAISPALKAAQR